ncbi:hypothetical protein RJ55_04433 [Drechmeria coniospora]|nr:hypothetical protein RJ55_04433 [Drechmeria coniospora]
MHHLCSFSGQSRQNPEASLPVARLVGTCTCTAYGVRGKPYYERAGLLRLRFLQASERKRSACHGIGSNNFPEASRSDGTVKVPRPTFGREHSNCKSAD